MTGSAAFQLTEADYLAANRLYARHAWWRPRTLVVFAGVGLFYAAMILPFTDPAPLAIALAVAAGFAIAAAVLALIWGLGWLLLPRQTRRLFRQTPLMTEPVSVAWDADGIRFASANAANRLAWAQVHRWALGEHCLLLFQNDRLFHILPRRALDAPALAAITARLDAAGVRRFGR